MTAKQFIIGFYKIVFFCLILPAFSIWALLLIGIGIYSACGGR